MGECGKYAVIKRIGIIKCPYCGHEHDGFEYIDTDEMDGEFEVQCDNPQCSETIYVEFNTIVTFASKSEYFKDRKYLKM